DATRGDGFVVNSRRPHECTEPVIPGLRHHAESGTDEDAVLSPERCDVRDCRKRNEIEECLDLSLIPSHPPHQLKLELECDSHSGEILVRIWTSLLARVEHGDAGRNSA